MTAVYKADHVPPITVFTDFLSIRSAKSSAPTSGAEVFDGVAFMPLTVWPHAQRLDILARGGGVNACCIVTGSNGGVELGLVAPMSGLNLTIKAGQGIAGTLAELPADFVEPIEAGHGGTDANDGFGPDVVWVWLKQNGTITKTIHTLVPPSGYNVLLGGVITNGTDITGVDFSGVAYLRSGTIVRTTGDTTTPVDTPDTSLRLVTRNPANGKEWLWNGDSHYTIPSAANALPNSDPFTQITPAIVQTANGTATTILTVTPTDNKATVYYMTVLGLRSDGAAMYSADVKYGIRKLSGTITQPLTITGATSFSGSDNASYAAAFSISGADLLFKVTGVVAETINWYVVGKYLETP